MTLELTNMFIKKYLGVLRTPQGPIKPRQSVTGFPIETCDCHHERCSPRCLLYDEHCWFCQGPRQPQQPGRAGHPQKPPEKRLAPVPASQHLRFWQSLYNGGLGSQRGYPSMEMTWKSHVSQRRLGAPWQKGQVMDAAAREAIKELIKRLKHSSRFPKGGS